MKSMQARLSPTFYAILSMPATAMGTALSIQIAALSWILSTKYKLDIHDVGLVWAAGPIAGIIGQVFIGIISDNVWFLNGRRRPFILIGGFLAALMLLALPNIDVISSAMGMDGILGVAMIVAIMLDLSINVSFNPTRAIIADVTPEGKERTKGYTWMQTVSGTLGVGAYFLGATAGNYVLIYIGAVVVLLFSVIPPFFISEPRVLASSPGQVAQVKVGFGEIVNTIQPLWGFLLYAVYAMTLRLGHIEVNNHYFEIFCIFLSLVLIVKAVMTSEVGKNKTDAGKIGFKKVLAAHSFTWIGVQTMFVYMFGYVQSKIPDLTADQQGTIVNYAFFTLSLVAALLPLLVLEPLARTYGRVRVHAVSIAVMAVGYAGMIFFGTSAIPIYVLMAVIGVGWSATISLPFAIMSQKVEQSRMGLYMGLFNLSVVLPQLVASLGVGMVISEAENKSVTFIIASVCLAISAFFWFLVKEDKDAANAQSKQMGGGGH